MTDNKSSFHSSLAVSNIRNHISITLEMENVCRRATSSFNLFRVSQGGIQWEKQVHTSAHIHRQGNMSVLVIGAVGFVGSHVSLVLKRHRDDIIGLDKHDVFIVEGDLNETKLLAKL
ncbi:hypothetical protein JHK84_052395 [Glycine max]|nr:hypothetical protein JHK84_052395 [Glycine max]